MAPVWCAVADLHPLNLAGLSAKGVDWYGDFLLPTFADLILDKVSESLVLNRSEPCTRAGLRNGHTNTTS